MTVGELIERLQNLDKDLPVMTDSPDGLNDVVKPYILKGLRPMDFAHGARSWEKTEVLVIG